MNNGHFLLLFVVLLTQIRSCPIDPNNLPSAMSCIQTIACVSNGNFSAILMQSCSKWWSYGTSSKPISFLTTVTNPPVNDLGTASPPSFILTGLSALSIKTTQNYSLIQLNSTMLYLFPLESTQQSNRHIQNCSLIDYEPIVLANGSVKIVTLCSSSLQMTTYDQPFNVLASQQIVLNYNATIMKCIEASNQCLIGTTNSRLLLLDLNNGNIANIYNTNMDSPISLIKTFSLGTNKYKIYVSFDNGILNEYKLLNKYIQLDRSCSAFKGEQIYSLETYPGSSYLIVTDKRGNVSQIDIDNGTLVDSVNVKPYLKFKDKSSMSLFFNNASSFYIYNTANSIVFFISTTSPNSQNKIILSCFDFYFYNNTLQQCQPCSSSCTTCNQLNGDCIDCIPEYFKDQGQCISCFYDSRGLTDKFGECFSSNQKMIMETSEEMVAFLSTMVSNFAVFLNLFGILFLFMKLINNWNIICLYFFIDMDLPFFLENVLKMLFTNINSSVLATIGIDFQPSISVTNLATNTKFYLTNQTTDFIAMNAQPFILFFYSVILITTVYKILNYILAKFNISVFEQNTAISIIEEFVGCFTMTLLPFYHVVLKTGYRNRIEKLNASMHLLFVGVSLIVPFCFLIFDYQYKIIRSNKVHNNDENLIAESVNLGLTKRIQAWREDDSKERFFYGLLSFSTALLVSSPEPRIFIYGVGFIHVLCVVNSFLCREIKVNILIQKFLFLAYHCLFSSLYYLQNGNTKFRISMVIVLLIILIAVHQTIVTIYRKIYFVYMLVKGKWEKEEKIKMFFEKNQKKMKQKNRIHPIILPPAETLKDFQSKNEIKIAFKNYEVRFVKQNIQEELQNKKFQNQEKRRKQVKSAKKVKNVQETVKEALRESQSGLLSPNAQRRKVKNH